MLESAQKVDTIVFDKTGTITYGKLKISKVINYSNLSEKELLQLVGSLESKSSHPIGKVFVEYLKEKNIKTLEVENFENIAGVGIVGKIAGENIALGNSKIVEKNNIENKYKDDELNLSKEGNSIIYVIKNNEIIK